MKRSPIRNLWTIFTGWEFDCNVGISSIEMKRWFVERKSQCDEKSVPVCCRTSCPHRRMCTLLKACRKEIGDLYWAGGICRDRTEPSTGTTTATAAVVANGSANNHPSASTALLEANDQSTPLWQRGAGGPAITTATVNNAPPAVGTNRFLTSHCQNHTSNIAWAEQT